MAAENFRTTELTVLSIGVTKSVANFDGVSLISPSFLVGNIPNLMEI